MVQMVVQMPDVAEWGMVELQGELETRDEVPLDGMHIGDLHFTNKGIPTLIVGHHILTGKVITLDKPYAVLRKKMQGALDGGEEGMELNSEGMEPDSEMGQRVGSHPEYEVVALISKKIIFKNRPKPIITKTAVKR